VTTCSTCGKELPGEFPFCPFCAAPLTGQPAASVQEERKIVTVLFCDLVGFTAASEAADPEDVRARIRPYHARLRQEIERYGGTVEKFIGDAVMVVFGAPTAHEDDAERAVRASLRILEAIAELNEAEPALSLQVRIGINTGEAVVALGARPEEGEGIVTGDVVNTASRLQGAAPVNGIAVSEQTYRQTERVFDYEELDPVQVKGKAEPLALYRPLAARARFGSDVANAGLENRRKVRENRLPSLRPFAAETPW
jgi:class 3 adenylate cyclase